MNPNGFFGSLEIPKSSLRFFMIRGFADELLKVVKSFMVITLMKDLFDLLPICMDCLRMSNSWPTHEPLMNGGILGILKDSRGFSGPLNTFKKKSMEFQSISMVTMRKCFDFLTIFRDFFRMPICRCLLEPPPHMWFP